MPAPPTIEIFVRHAANCAYRSDERWKRCQCRKHLRWSWKGRQYRQTAKTRSWSSAERAKRQLELKFEAAQLDKPTASREPSTVDEAVAAFLAEKRGGQSAANTLAKYKLTLSRLQEFCDRQNLHFIREIRLEHLSAWRTEWSSYYLSAFALRNNQSRLRHFFSYAQNAGMIHENPATKLSAIKISDDDYDVDPFTQKQYRSILAAAGKCAGLSVGQRARVSTLIETQRWSGLSLVDAVCLQRSDLIKTGTKYRIDTSRRKSGVRVSNVIPGWLGKRLLSLPSSNSQYFFWSGESTPKSATSVYEKLYRKVFEQAGIVDGGSHRFRHLFAVSLLEKGVDIRVVSKALGHKSLAITERYYAKWSRQQQVNLERALVKTWD